MKKSLALVLVLSLVLAIAGFAMAEEVMTYADYVAADDDTAVVVETYV